MARRQGIGLGGALFWALVGVAATVLFDPSNGRRRRAQLRDRAIGSWHRGRAELLKRLRDLEHRTLGRVAVVRSAATGTAVDDDVLVERVRSRLGRLVHHASRVHVELRRGRVILTGAALAEETERLLAQLSRVRGVDGVENHLRIYPDEGALLH
jgi:hypothetical protein